MQALREGCSLDLANSDFSLFEKLKTALMGEEFGDEREKSLKPFLTNGE
jgi:hypothetical protein